MSVRKYRCSNCQSKSFSFVEEKRKAMMGDNRYYDVLQCNSCGMTYDLGITNTNGLELKR